MFTSLIRALQGPYQVHVSFTSAQPPLQLVVFWRLVLFASVSLQLLENVNLCWANHPCTQVTITCEEIL